MITVARVWNAIKWMASFYALTSTVIERMSLTLFFMRFCLVRLIPTLNLDDDSPLLVEGARYVVGLRTSEIYTFEEFYLDRFYDELEEFLPRSRWTVFDIGANCGLYTIKAAKEGAFVYTFEPNPDCFRRLSKAVERNDFRTTVKPYNLALGAEAGFGTIDIPFGYATTAGVVVPWEDRGKVAPVRVSIAKLDDITDSIAFDRIDLVKIDVEGSEIDVLEGAKNTLKRTDRLVIEYHSPSLLQQIRDLLKACDFVEVALVPLKETSDVGLIYATSLA